jgi:hypothetical protein
MKPEIMWPVGNRSELIFNKIILIIKEEKLSPNRPWKPMGL